MARVRRAVVIAALLAGATLSPVSSAQPRDAAAAEALFRQGREASDEGDHRTACAKFRESHRLDPALGTLFNIADCEERLGNVATAWTTFREVAQRLPPADDRRPLAEQRASLLEDRLPRLSVHFEGPSPPGTKITRNGVPLGSASMDAHLPVDPGVQRVIVDSPGRARAIFEIQASEGSRQTLTVRVGAPNRGAAALGSDASTPGEPAPKSGSPTLGWLVGGVGVVGLAVGSIAGVAVLSKKSTVDANCDARKVCNREGADAADEGRTLSTVSTAGFVVGALGIGLGGYLLLSTSKDGSETALAPAAGTRGGSVTLRRTF